MPGALSAISLAKQIFERAGYRDGAEPSGIGRLVRDLFGANALTYSRDDDPMPARLLDGPSIVVRRDLDGPQTALAVARCLAVWVLTEHEEPLDTSQIDDLVIALLVPPRALADARASSGVDIVELCAEFVCPPWVMRRALRDALARRGAHTHLRLVG